MSIKLTFLFLLCSYFCVGQEINISGKVLDENNLPISYANVLLISSTNKSEILGTITNNDGTFALEANKAGTYNLEISFVGYFGYKKELLIEQAIVLKPVILKEKTQAELKVIEIVVDEKNK